jgi:DNA-binding transcriptional regulator GbsR (MarR family)
MLHRVIEGNTGSAGNLNRLELDVLELFGQFSKVLGYPKSVGEIYGTLYLSGDYMSMGDIVDKLEISLGSVSQGLRVLKELEAISVGHSDTARRGLFRAETNYWQFLSCFLRDRIQPEIQVLRERIERIGLEASQESGLEPSVVRRIDGIREIHALLVELIPVVRVVLEARK